MLLAVLERRTGTAFASLEVYASVVGGVKLSDPGSDLGICLALASAALDKPVKPPLAAIGEVGLGGEVRHVNHLERRVREAARMGFSQILVPANTKPIDSGRTSLVRVSTVAEAISHAF
jgi:DNA repair protein RadA/Sms